MKRTKLHNLAFNLAVADAMERHRAKQDRCQEIEETATRLLEQDYLGYLDRAEQGERG